MSENGSRRQAGHRVLVGDAFAAWMGVRLVEAGAGRSVLEMTVRDEHANGFGIMHGGMVFAFADTAFAMACNEPTGDGSEVIVSSGVNVDFLRPAHPGDTLRAIGTVVHRGRSGLCDVRIVVVAADGSDGPVVAQFRGRSRMVPARNVPRSPRG